MRARFTMQDVLREAVAQLNTINRLVEQVLPEARGMQPHEAVAALITAHQLSRGEMRRLARKVLDVELAVDKANAHAAKTDRLLAQLEAERLAVKAERAEHKARTAELLAQAKRLEAKRDAQQALLDRRKVERLELQKENRRLARQLNAAKVTP